MRKVLVRIWNYLSCTFQHWLNDDGLTLAAAVAFYAAFSFLPLVLLLLSGIGFVLRASDFAKGEQQALLDTITQNTSPDFAKQIKGIIDSVKSQAPVGGPLGFLTLLLGGMALFSQIDAAFERMWQTSEPKHATFFAWVHQVLVDRFKAFLMLLGLGALIVASFVMGIVMSTLAAYAKDFAFAQTGWQVVRIFSVIFLNSILFTIMFKVLPRAPVRWREAAPGGIFTAVVWEVGRLILALVVIGGRYSAYGVVGTFIAMMIWVYYAAAIVFLGAEFVKVTHDNCQPKPARPAPSGAEDGKP